MFALPYPQRHVPYLRCKLSLYRAKTANAPTAANMTAGISVLAGAALGLCVCDACPAAPSAEVTMFEAEATSEGLGLALTAAQISGASVEASGGDISYQVFIVKRREAQLTLDVVTGAPHESARSNFRDQIARVGAEAVKIGR